MWSSCSEELVGGAATPPSPHQDTPVQVTPAHTQGQQRKRAQMHFSRVPSRGRPPRPQAGGSLSACCELRPPRGVFVLGVGVCSQFPAGSGGLQRGLQGPARGPLQAEGALPWCPAGGLSGEGAGMLSPEPRGMRQVPLVGPSLGVWRLRLLTPNVRGPRFDPWSGS